MQALSLMRKFAIPIDGILHVGANDGIERFEYLHTGASPCIYVEPIAEVHDRLQDNIRGMNGHVAIRALCSDVAGEKVHLNIASNGGQSSSIFELGNHAIIFPDITYTDVTQMYTTTIDEVISGMLLEEPPNLLVIDTQGAELKVLKGAEKSLGRVDAVFVEVSETPLYKGSCIHKDITAFLEQFSFYMRWMELNIDGYGDAFYCKRRVPADLLPTYNGNLALQKKASQSSLSIWSKSDDAQGAVNGRKTGSYGFHTAEEDCPYWQIDLGQSLRLNEIRVYNRIDAAPSRARTLKVLASNDATAWTVMHDQEGRSFGGVDGRPLRICCNDKPRARFIRLELNERTYLHLDEVEVY